MMMIATITSAAALAVAEQMYLVAALGQMRTHLTNQYLRALRRGKRGGYDHGDAQC